MPSRFPGLPSTAGGWRGLLISSAFRGARFYLLAYASVAVLAMAMERRMVFQPGRAEELGELRLQGIEAREIELLAADGTRVSAIHLDERDADRTIIFFHGNNGTVLDRLDWIVALAFIGADVLALEYRGYGRSEGVASEPGIYLDAEAAYRYVTQSLGVPPERIVLLGKSLGGGSASEIASIAPVAGLIMQSTFTSVPDLAGAFFTVFPVGFLARTTFDNASKVGGIDCPKLFIHSRKDELIPFELGQALYERAAEPKRSLWLDEGGHNDLIHTQRWRLLSAIRAFLDEVAPRARPEEDR